MGTSRCPKPERIPDPGSDLYLEKQFLFLFSALLRCNRYKMFCMFKLYTWFATCIYYKMITIRTVNTFIVSLNNNFFWMGTFKILANFNSLSNFQVYSYSIIAMVTILNIRSLELIHFITGSWCSSTMASAHGFGFYEHVNNMNFQIHEHKIFPIIHSFYHFFHVS